MPTTLKVLLCDRGAALDLCGSPLLVAARAWKLKLAVTGLAFERELRGTCADPGKTLRVEHLAAPELQRAIALRRAHIQLSLCDACTLSLAAQRSWALLTANRSLARFAGELAIEVHDLEWLRLELAQLDELSPQERAIRLSPSVADGNFYGGIGQSSV